MFARKGSCEGDDVGVVADARPYSPLMPSSTPPLVMPHGESPRRTFLGRQKARLKQRSSNKGL